MLSLRAEVSSPSATWSRSATPYLRPSGRGSPAASLAAASASSSTGRASHRASTAVSQAASTTAAPISAAITASAAPPRPAPITSAGTPTIRTATNVTAKLDNHSLLRIVYPGAREVGAPARGRGTAGRGRGTAGRGRGLGAEVSSVAAFKAESDAPDRGDVPGAVRVVAELAAQPGDVHIERLGGRPPLRVPDLAHDLLAGDHLARVAQQDPEQVEFLGGQVEFGIAVPGPPGVRVDPHPERGRAFRRPAPQ